MLPFLFPATAHAQSNYDSSSSQYFSSGKTPDDRATGLVSRPSRPTVVQPPQQVVSDSVAPVPPKLRSFSVSASFNHVNDRAVKWNGCSSNTLVKGGKGTNTGCDEDYLHPSMAAHMEKSFFKCAVRASADAGISRPARLHLNHAGTFSNRTVAGTEMMSLHALGRAIDINAFNLYDSNNKVTRISTNIRDYRGKTKAFYDSFRSCWRKSLPRSCQGRYSREQEGSIGLPGSAEPNNGAHADHLHLTFPPCGG